MIKRFQNIGKPCPGPQLAGEDICPYTVVIDPSRGPRAQRCRDCAYRREYHQSMSSQRKMRARNRRLGEKLRAHTAQKVAAGIPRNGIMPIAGDRVRKPIKRCKACLGCPHLREPGREDEMGVPVCLPGMARCWRCWGAYAPLPEIHSRSVLGSSAATAASSAQW